MLNKNKKRKVYFIQFLKSYVCFLRASNLNINLYVKHSVLDNGVICLPLVTFCFCQDGGHSGGVHCVQWHPQDSLLYSGSDDTNIIEWDLQTGKTRRSVSRLLVEIQYVCFLFFLILYYGVECRASRCGKETLSPELTKSKHLCYNERHYFKNLNGILLELLREITHVKQELQAVAQSQMGQIGDLELITI